MNENDQLAGPHEHEHRPARLGLAASANSAFAVVQIVVGLAIGSVVVLADAAHQTVAALGLITAWVAIRIARRAPSDRWSYGLGKADALGGVVSALLLLASIAWIVVEATQRLADPEPVDGGGVIAIGLIAIAVNAAGVALVGHGHGDEAISLRAARLHLLTDLGGSVIVVVAGIAIAVTDASWIDPTASLLLCAAVLWSTWGIIRSAVHVLLDRAPAHASPAALRDLLETHLDVRSAHHVHVRSLGAGRYSASAHVVIAGAQSVHRSQDLPADLASLLARDLGLDHVTLQLECHACERGDVESVVHDSR